MEEEVVEDSPLIELAGCVCVFVSSEFQSLLHGLFDFIIWGYFAYKVLNSLGGLLVMLYLLMNEFVFVDLVKYLYGPYKSTGKEIIQSAH
jgi:hypothetical protein